MKVILLKSQDKLGNVGDIVNVKSGYARNYLIPNKIASTATKENISMLNAWVEQQEIKEAKNAAIAASKAFPPSFNMRAAASAVLW